MGHTHTMLRCFEGFTEAGRAARSLKDAAADDELQAKIMELEAREEQICRAAPGCQCTFHRTLAASKEELRAWLEAGAAFDVQCRVTRAGIPDSTESVEMRVLQRLSVGAVKRLVVRDAAKLWGMSDEVGCIVAQLIALDKVELSMGDRTVGDDEISLEDAGVESAAVLSAVIENGAFHVAHAEAAKLENKDRGSQNWKQQS